LKLGTVLFLDTGYVPIVVEIKGQNHMITKSKDITWNPQPVR